MQRKFLSFPSKILDFPSTYELASFPFKPEAFSFWEYLKEYFFVFVNIFYLFLTSYYIIFLLFWDSPGFKISQRENLNPDVGETLDEISEGGFIFFLKFLGLSLSIFLNLSIFLRKDVIEEVSVSLSSFIKEVFVSFFSFLPFLNSILNSILYDGIIIIIISLFAFVLYIIITFQVSFLITASYFFIYILFYWYKRFTFAKVFRPKKDNIFTGYLLRFLKLISFLFLLVLTSVSPIILLSYLIFFKPLNFPFAIKNFWIFTNTTTPKILSLTTTIQNSLWYYVIFPVFFIFMFSFSWDIFNKRMLSYFLRIRVGIVDFFLDKEKEILRFPKENEIVSEMEMLRNSLFKSDPKNYSYIIVGIKSWAFKSNRKEFEKIKNEFADLIFKFISGEYIANLLVKTHKIVIIHLMTWITLIFSIFIYYFFLLDRKTFYYISSNNFESFMALKFRIFSSGILIIFIWLLAYLRSFYLMFPEKEELKLLFKTFYNRLKGHSVIERTGVIFSIYYFNAPPLLLSICKKLFLIFSNILDFGSSYEKLSSFLDNSLNETKSIRENYIYKILISIIFISVLTIFLYIFSSLLESIQVSYK